MAAPSRHPVLACALLLLAPASSSTNGLLPSSGDPIAEFLARRSAFIAQEQTYALGSNLTLDAAEERLDSWVSGEVQKLVDKHRSERMTHRFVSAKYFPSVRQEIAGTALFRVLEAMPKGGVLHLHSGAAGSLDWIVGEGLDLPGCYVYTGKADENNASSPPWGTIEFFNATEPRPAGYVSARELVQSRPGFREEMRRLLTFHPLDERRSSAQAWAKFNEELRWPMKRTEPARAYMLDGLTKLARSGVSYAELRIVMSPASHLTDLSGLARRGVDFLDFFGEVLGEVQQTEPSFDMRLILCSLRTKAPEDVEADLQYAFEMRRARPGLVVGWDIVAEEDAGHATLDYAAQLLKIPELERRYGVAMPVVLHDGESVEPGNRNALDAVLLGSRRLGHGFNVFNFPLLRRELGERGVALEVCPISNQILRYVDDLRLHPGGQYVKEGLPVVLAPDDPLLWNVVGVTHDFWLATVSWELGLKSIKALARGSLQHSLLPDGEKAEALAAWKRQWHEFLGKWESLVSSPGDQHLVV